MNKYDVVLCNENSLSHTDISKIKFKHITVNAESFGNAEKQILETGIENGFGITGITLCSNAEQKSI